MTYEMVYQRLCVIRDKNYADPADFANDVLSLMASFERKQAAEQERAADVVSPAEEKEYLAEMNKVASELLG